jgi:hypothetical protein
MTTPIKLDDLIDAFDWVSAALVSENSAYINKVTGEIFFDSVFTDMEEALPDNYKDANIYIAIPHKYDLDLGNNLVFQFVGDMIPECIEEVQVLFRKHGAYARFSELLERKGVLEDWHEYRANAIEAALREWANDNHLQLASDSAVTEC